MKQKLRMPKKFRRQIKKDKRKKELKEIDTFLEEMRNRLLRGEKIDDEMIEEISKNVE